MKKILGVIAVLVIPVAVAFYAGVFNTAFETNLCYSNVLGELSERAQAAAASGDSVHMAHYARLMTSLPLHGHESQCEKILAAIEAAPGSPPVRNVAPAGN